MQQWKNTIWDKRLPTLLGILFIAIGIVVSSFLVNTQTSLISRANPSQTPKSIRITNVSDTSFTVTYATGEKYPGTISYGLTKTFQDTVLDDRDVQRKSVSSYTLHHITARNLTAQTTYYFVIVSGQTIFLNNGAPFEVTTAPVVITSPSSFTARGKVIHLNGAPPEEGIVFVKTEKSQTLSALTQPDGRYSIPLASLRTKDLLSAPSVSDEDVFSILINSDSLLASATILAKHLDSIPTILLSKDYDFRNTTLPFPLPSAQPLFASILGSIAVQPKPPVTPKVTQTPKIPSPTITSPTPSPSPSPTLTPTPTIGPTHPVTLQSLPPPGNTSLSIATLAASLFITVGLALLLSTRENVSSL